MKLGKNAALLGGAQALNLLVTLVSRVLFARILGSVIFGQFTFALNTITVLSRILGFGLAPATQYEASRDSNRSRETLGSSLLLSVLTCGFACGVSYLALPWIRSTFFSAPLGKTHEEAFLIFQHLLPGLPLVMIAMILGVMFVPLGKVKEYAVVQSGALLPLTLLFALLALVVSPIQAAVSSQLAAWAAVLIYLTFHLRKFVFGAKVSKEMLVDLAKYSFRAAPNSALSIGVARFATLFGAGYMHKAELSIFALALNLVDALMAPYNATGQLLLTSTAASEDFLPESTARFLRVSWFVFFAAILCLALTGFWLIPLIFGPGFEGSYACALVLSISGFLHAQFKSISNVFAGNGRPETTTLALATEVVVLLGGIALIGPLWGLWGVVLASVMAALTGWLIMTLLLVKESKEPLSRLMIPRREDVVLLREKLGRFRRRPGDLLK